MQRVRACESGRRAIETRYFALLQRKKRRKCAGLFRFTMFFSDKRTEKMPYYLLLLYFLKGYSSDFRPPQRWIETRFLESINNANMLICYMQASQIG